MSKEEAEHKLLYAVGDYVDEIGGKVIVAGGIRVEHWPGEEFRFRVSVQCTGRRPTKDPAPDKLNPEDAK